VCVMTVVTVASVLPGSSRSIWFPLAVPPSSSIVNPIVGAPCMRRSSRRTGPPSLPSKSTFSVERLGVNRGAPRVTPFFVAPRKTTPASSRMSFGKFAIVRPVSGIGRGV
jgi:hypothetical protein